VPHPAQFDTRPKKDPSTQNPDSLLFNQNFNTCVVTTWPTIQKNLCFKTQ
jgi:hypothetical protein